MEKINVAELLKDCPKGMELDCTMFEGVYFDHVDESRLNRIKCYVNNGDEHFKIEFEEYGQYISNDSAKCVIFPKGKTTWEGFVPPCRFKDGDILFVDCSDGEDKSYQYIFILNKPELYGKWHSYCHLDGVGYFHSKETYLTDDEYNPRLATEEEKTKLFKAIKDNGYKWNAETKTLEKLPKFKVGDRVRSKHTNNSYTICHITSTEYKLTNGTSFAFNDEDCYELAPNKFDITTLVPFESRVLVRGDKSSYWKPAIFGCYIKDMIIPYYALGGTCWHQCIPYEGNEHLLGTTNDCDEFYKTWK